MHALAARLGRVLADNAATAVKVDGFGALSERAAFTDALAPHIGDLPVTWVEGEGCDGAPVAGLTVLAVSGVQVDTLVVNGRSVGRAYDDGDARWLWLGDLAPTDTSRSPEAQARDLFAMLAKILAGAGLPASSLARTWFYLGHLLDWYGSFNAARDDVFARVGWLDILPASTAVDARNARGAALVGGALAVAFHDGFARVLCVDSPLQGPAPAYGSRFSRAVEIVSGGTRRLLVSGTASIDPSGKTVHHGDIQGQVGRTLDVVEALLGARGMGFADVTRVVAYVARPEFGSAFDAWRERMPMIVTRCGICRSELLCEVEMDAVVRAA